MLTKQAICQTLLQHKPKLKTFGVAKIGLFGSYAQAAQHLDSDIDLLASFEQGEETFDNFMDLCFYLDEFFAGEKVELVTTNGLSEFIAPYVLAEVEYV